MFGLLALFFCVVIAGKQKLGNYASDCFKSVRCSNDKIVLCCFFITAHADF